MAGFESFTDLSRKYGRTSDQRRFAGLYREQDQEQARRQQQQDFGLEQSKYAASAPFGSLDAQNNPLAYGSVFRDENKGFAGALDAQASAKQAEEEAKQRRQQQADEEHRQNRYNSLRRDAYTGGTY